MNGGCGTTAGWKTSPYVHLLLGGKPQASCTPHSGLPGRAKTFDLLFVIRFSMLLLLLLFREWDNIKLRCFKINNYTISSQLKYHAIQTRCCKTLHNTQTNSWSGTHDVSYHLPSIHPLHSPLNRAPVLGEWCHPASSSLPCSLPSHLLSSPISSCLY